MYYNIFAEGVIFQLKYKDIDFNCDTVQCTVDDQLVFIKLHQNIEQNVETNTNNEKSNIDENYNDNNYERNLNANNNNENDANEINQDKKELSFWDDAKTKLFLDLYKEKNNLLINRKMKTKKVLWQKIKEDMQKFGYNLTLPQVENKYKSLERSYKNMVTNNNKTGRARMSCRYVNIHFILIFI